MLAANGLVTCDSVIPLRARIDGKQNRGKQNRGRPDRKRARRSVSATPTPLRTHPMAGQPPASRRPRAQRQVGAGRWSLLESFDPVDAPLEAQAMQLLHRYGVVFPELMARERMAPRWRDLARVYRRLEARGEIRGGRFVSGFVGEQFALPDAVTALREAHRAPHTGALEVVSACDPLNLVGIVTPGERVPAQPGNRVVFRDGVPVASLEKGIVVNRCNADAGDLDASTMDAAANLLYGPMGHSRPEKRRSYGAYQDSTQPDWPLPDEAALEPASAVRFNRN